MNVRPKILPTNRYLRARLLLGKRSQRAIAGICFLFVMIVGQLPAHAVSEPLLRATSPRNNGFARSAYTPSISASFDRDLALPPSTFTLSDSIGAVAGSVSLTSMPDDPAGAHTLKFTLGSPMSELRNPYNATVNACPVAPGDCAHVMFTFRIDDTKPLAPVILDPLDGSVADGQPQTIQGTAESGAAIHIWEHDQVLAIVTAHTDGSWIAQLPFPAEDGTLHTVSVYAADEAGNASDPAVTTFRHDSIVRPPVINYPLSDAYVGTTAVTVSGTAKANTSVEIAEGSTVVGTTPAGTDGKWSTVITFSEATHVIVARSYDTYEVDGPSAARTFTVDVTAPAGPVFTAPGAGASLSSRTVTVSGTAEPNASVRIRESTLARATTPVDAAGAWTLDISFTEGAHTITAEAFDRAGNVSVAVPRSFTVDTIAPAPPSITVPAEHAFLASNAVTLSGSSEPNATVTAYEGVVVLGTTTASGGGAWSLPITLPDGAHTITAAALDTAGNASARSAPRHFTVDTVAPAVPVIVTPEEGATIGSHSVLVSGTADGGTIITIEEGMTVLGTVTADGTGNWAKGFTFADGVHQVDARSTDAAGNISAASTLRTFTVDVQVDVTPPVAPIIDTPVEGATVAQHVSVTGTAEPGATVRIYEGASLLTSAAANGAGAWTTGITLISGPHSITAKAVDAAQNVGPASAVRSFIVDGGRPTVTIDQVTALLLLDPLTKLQGTATDNIAVARIDIEVDQLTTGSRVLTTTATTCTGCPGPSITWSTMPALAPGLYTVRAYAVDEVGNRSDAATATSIFV